MALTFPVKSRKYHATVGAVVLLGKKNDVFSQVRTSLPSYSLDSVDLKEKIGQTRALPETKFSL